MLTPPSKRKRFKKQAMPVYSYPFPPKIQQTTTKLNTKPTSNFCCLLFFQGCAETIFVVFYCYHNSILLKFTTKSGSEKNIFSRKALLLFRFSLEDAQNRLLVKIFLRKFRKFHKNHHNYPKL